MKNRFIFKTFLRPNQSVGLNLIKMKLNPIGHIVKDKEIILIDDSIIRETSISFHITALKNAGAKKVHVRIACPPILFPCKFGINLAFHKLYESVTTFTIGITKIEEYIEGSE